MTSEDWGKYKDSLYSKRTAPRSCRTHGDMGDCEQSLRFVTTYGHPGIIALAPWFIRNLCADGLYRVFSLTWSASMQIYWNKRRRLHKKKFKLPRDLFGTPTWPPFHCLGSCETLYCYISIVQTLTISFDPEFFLFHLGLQSNYP